MPQPSAQSAAITSHALSHHGYAPLAGLLTVPGIDPAGLSDPGRVKYEFFSGTLSGVTVGVHLFRNSDVPHPGVTA